MRQGFEARSVWDYPTTPVVEPAGRLVTVIFNGEVVARSAESLRVLERGGAPTYYVPPEDVQTRLLRKADADYVCEWKGRATHYDIVVGDRIAHRAAWSYLAPTSDYWLLAGHVAFYAGRVDNCFVDDEEVAPQPGGIYGGWITKDVLGPFKGEPDAPA